tara:strand:- start:500 stop:1045 length:546 start_codon:yes stop_codon:yes gene_type:complete
MNFNYLIRFTPFLSTIILIIFLSISNNKEITKLRILIWDTPKLTLGTYLAISTGSGFVFSYFITNNLAKTIKISQKKSLRFNENDKSEFIKDYSDLNKYTTYDKTLIERDVKDPSPTLDASFRIIGKNERSNSIYINNNNTIDERLPNFDEQFEDNIEEDETINKTSSLSTDWNDETYSNW